MSEEATKRSLIGFSPEFFWGAGSCPTQVEGQVVNEWSEILAHDKGSADEGPQHLSRFEFDFSCLRDMGCNVYRFGFDWARLQPEPYAPLDPKVTLIYMEMLADLRSRNIKPILSLFDFACPAWFAHSNGWLNKDAPKVFADFAGKVSELSDGEVDYFITVAQPEAYATMAYMMEEMPPFSSKQHLKVGKVVKQLAKGHALAYGAIKKWQPEAKVGFTRCGMDLSRSATPGLFDKLVAAGAHMFCDSAAIKPFIEQRKKSICDFVGLDCYSHLSGSDQAGDIPQCLQRALHELSQQTDLPIIVTGCGVGTDDEEVRRETLLNSIAVCRQAIADKVNLEGFVYWSLIDGFEWKAGYQPCFGLVEVDFKHSRRFRRLRSTGKLYGEITRQNR